MSKIIKKIWQFRYRFLATLCVFLLVVLNGAKYVTNDIIRWTQIIVFLILSAILFFLDDKKNKAYYHANKIEYKSLGKKEKTLYILFIVILSIPLWALIIYLLGEVIVNIFF